jgi:hypothetical protein
MLWQIMHSSNSDDVAGSHRYIFLAYEQVRAVREMSQAASCMS